jgi:lysine-N-methylase
LCDIIRTLGEDALCDICADHPRFRTYRDDSVHIGLGMCCEEACRLILSEDAVFLCEESGNPVAVDTALPALKDTRLPAEWATIYRRLERMDSAWDTWLCELEKAPDWRLTDTDFTRRLGAYFRFRYPDEPLFAAHAVAVLDTLCAGRSAEQQCEICRLYSAEIEYSDENRQLVCEQIKSATE